MVQPFGVLEERRVAALAEQSPLAEGDDGAAAGQWRHAAQFEGTGNP